MRDVGGGVGGSLVGRQRPPASGPYRRGTQVSGTLVADDEELRERSCYARWAHAGTEQDKKACLRAGRGPRYQTTGRLSGSWLWRGVIRGRHGTTEHAALWADVGAGESGSKRY